MGGMEFRFGPLALTSTLTTNILNPGTTTGGVNCTAAPYAVLHLLIHHIRLTNKTGSAATVTLYIGATGANAAGTELLVAKSVPANDYVDVWFPSPVRLGTADFLVGGASANATITIQGHGEIGVGA